MSRKLCLFTIDFPFSTGEVFLENEIPILSDHFDQILIFPSRKLDQCARKLPANVEVVEILISDTTFSVWQWLKGLLPFATVYLQCIIHSRSKGKYWKYFRSLTSHFWKDHRKYKPLKSYVINHHLKDAIFYDYWSQNTNITLAKLRKNGFISKFVCRAHGFDLYNDRNFEEIVPFREYKYAYADRVYFISQHGLNFVKGETKPSLHNKYQVSYLGVKKPTGLPQQKDQSGFILVSCAQVIPLKRLTLIPRVLKKLNMDKPIHWIHFGDGYEMELLKESIADLPANIDAELKGHFRNEDLMSFYQNNYIDLFISLSKSEGLPVSMMEAQSFGVPIFTCNVNGIPEIVNEKTGVLLPLDLPIEKLASKLEQTLRASFDRNDIRGHFDRHFDSETNYTHFADLLTQL